VSRKLFHKDHIEDFWANYPDDYEVMKRAHSRLSLDFIKKFHIMAVPDQLQDDENIMVRGPWETQYHLPIPLPNWVNAKESSLDVIMKEPIKLSKAWVRAQLGVLRGQGVQLTYTAVESDKDSDGEEDEPVLATDDADPTRGKDSDIDEHAPLATRARKVKKPPVRSPRKKDPPPRARASKRKDMPGSAGEASKAKKVKTKAASKESVTTKDDSTPSISQTPMPDTGTAVLTSTFSTSIPPPSSVSSTSPTTSAVIMQESSPSASPSSDITTTSCPLAISSGDPSNPISPTLAITYPTLSSPLPLPAFANLTQISTPSFTISSAVPISQMPVGSLEVPLLAGIEKVCTELGLQEHGVVTEKSKEVLTCENDKNPLDTSVGIEIIDISDSPLSKDPTEEVLKIAQENVLESLNELAQGEKEKSPEPEQEPSKELVVSDKDGATELNKSSAPEWLQDRMVYPEPQIEVMKIDLSTILSQAQKPQKQKRAKVQSRIYQSESGSRIVEVAVPLADVARDQVRAEDYVISAIDLGPTTRAQRVDDFKGSVTSILKQLDKDEMSKRELKCQNEELRACLQFLVKPIDAGGDIRTVPTFLSTDEMAKLSKVRSKSQGVENWLMSVFEVGCDAISASAQVHQRTVELLKKWKDLHDECDLFDEYYSHMYPRIRGIRELPAQTLVTENILTGDRLPKAIEWYQQLLLRKETFEQVKEAYKPADEELRSVIYDISDALRSCRDESFDDYAPFEVEKCKGKLHVILFEDTVLSTEERLDKASDLRAEFKAFRRAETDFERIYTRFSRELEVFNYRIHHLKDLDPSDINPALEAWLTYRNKLSSGDSIDLDKES